MATSLNGTIWGRVTISASPATVSIPTWSSNIITQSYTFTVPSGVQTVALNPTIDVSGGTFTLGPIYIGVTSGSLHKLTSFGYQRGQSMVFGVQCGTHNNMSWAVYSVPFADFNYFTYRISWSPEINAHTPDITDY